MEGVTGKYYVSTKGTPVLKIMKVIFSISSSSKRKKANSIHVSITKSSEYDNLSLTGSVMVIDMLTLKIISMCIILIEVLRKRWLQAFFKKERFYFEIVLQINLKIYSFQAAGKNKIIAKNALLPDIYISIKSSASDGTQFFA